MATIDLGKLGFVNKGTYNNSTTYEKNDLVQFTDGGLLSTYLYIDSTAQSGQAPSSSGTAGSRWVYFAKGGAAGADGTDVAAVLNNNEIAFKTNAGALDGLAIGSANTFLKVNSGANGYEFGAVSSDFVKLETQEITSNAGSVTFKGFANSIYGSYQLEVSDLQKSGTGDHRLNFRWCINNGNVTSGGYRSSFNGQHFNNGGNTNINVDGNWDSDHIQITNWNLPDTRNSGYQVRHLSMTFTNLSNASHSPVFHYKQISPHPGGTYTNHDVGGGYHSGSETRKVFGSGDGFTLYPVGDNIAKGIFTLYGRKK